MLDKAQSRLTRRAGMAFLAAISIIALPEATSAATEKVELLFVQSAPDVTVTNGQLRMKSVGPTLFFSDRPKRIAGHFSSEEWQKLWTQGHDSMVKNPPNAALSVFEPGKKDPTETAVELVDMKSDGADLVYTIKVLKGSLPAAGGQSSLFIDGAWSTYDTVDQRDCVNHGMCGY